jgi:hypothetical protein
MLMEIRSIAFETFAFVQLLLLTRNFQPLVIESSAIIRLPVVRGGFSSPAVLGNTAASPRPTADGCDPYWWGGGRL